MKELWEEKVWPTCEDHSGTGEAIRTCGLPATLGIHIHRSGWCLYATHQAKPVQKSSYRLDDTWTVNPYPCPLQGTVLFFALLHQHYLHVGTRSSLCLDTEIRPEHCHLLPGIGSKLRGVDPLVELLLAPDQSHLPNQHPDTFQQSQSVGSYIASISRW